MHIPPAYLNTQGNLKKVFSSGYRHYFGQRMLIHKEEGIRQVVSFGIEDEESFTRC